MYFDSTPLHYRFTSVVSHDYSDTVRNSWPFVCPCLSLYGAPYGDSTYDNLCSFPFRDYHAESIRFLLSEIELNFQINLGIESWQLLWHSRVCRVGDFSRAITSLDAWLRARRPEEVKKMQGKFSWRWGGGGRKGTRRHNRCKPLSCACEHAREIKEIKENMSCGELSFFPPDA